MLLINPPVTKPSEAPAGIAKLAGSLRRHGCSCDIIDANVEGLLDLLGQSPVVENTWTKRALRNRESNLKYLRQWRLYENIDRYRRTVKDLNRLLDELSRPFDTHVSLGNFQHHAQSPLRSDDLIDAADHPEKNPFSPYFEKRLAGALEKTTPAFLGFSLNYLSQALTTFAMIGIVRRLVPSVPVILGGGLVTSWLSNPLWSNPFSGYVDKLIAGPGEETLVNLAGLSLDNDLISSDYTDFKTVEYLSPGFILPYSASWGCYWNRCSFCPERAEGTVYAARPVDEIASELESLITTTKPFLVHFVDNAMSPALLNYLATVPLGVPWYGFARVTEKLADEGFCMDLKRSGCVMLKLGIESGDQGVLDALQKGIKLATASNALKQLRKAGIASYVYLLFGTPPESYEEARRTMEFVVDHRDDISFLNVAIFNMPAYGPDTAWLQTDEFYPGDLSLYRRFKHPKGWERSLVRQFLDREFKRNSAIAVILNRDPPIFTSNHAPFFALATQGSFKSAAVPSQV
ncbi:MAG: radical SAM protein [Deltaproteobacteria bacterium]|nr:radical SAM protein [Deltaproteobacteria bacterium]